MAEITDSPFRTICHEFGADVVYSEMISINAINFNNKRTLDMLEINRKEHPVVIQLFGSKPEIFAKAAKVVENFGADGIDINFGCPAKKIVKNREGAILMRNLKLSREIIQATIKAVKIPVSIKIRAGIKTDQCGNELTRSDITALDFVKNIMDLPIAAVMIHGRTYEQGFSGSSDYEMIKKVVELVENKIIILGNGGIRTPEDAREMLLKTGAHGIGLAQGVLGRPWLFREIKKSIRRNNTLGNKKIISQPGNEREKNAKNRALQSKDTFPLKINIDEIKKTALRHAKLAYKIKGDRGIIEMRKHLLWYMKGFPNAKELREKLVRVKTIDDIRKILK